MSPIREARSRPVRRRRPILCGAAASVAVLALTTDVAFALQQFTVSSDPVPAGGRLFYSGDSCPSGGSVFFPQSADVSLSTSPPIDGAVFRSDFLVDQNLNIVSFTGTLDVPSRTAPGRYVLRADCRGGFGPSRSYPSATFQVTAGAAQAPSAPASGAAPAPNRAATAPAATAPSSAPPAAATLSVQDEVLSVRTAQREAEVDARNAERQAGIDARVQARAADVAVRNVEREAGLAAREAGIAARQAERDAEVAARRAER